MKPDKITPAEAPYNAAEGSGKEDQLSIEDYKEVFEDHKRLVRELDTLLNGENAAKQASLCDIVGQLRKRHNFSLQDMIECWNACANYWDQNRDNSKTSWYSKEYPNKENYFKEKFNITLNQQQNKP